MEEGLYRNKLAIITHSHAGAMEYGLIDSVHCQFLMQVSIACSVLTVQTNIFFTRQVNRHFGHVLTAELITFILELKPLVLQPVRLLTDTKVSVTFQSAPSHQSTLPFTLFIGHSQHAECGNGVQSINSHIVQRHSEHAYRCMYKDSCNMNLRWRVRSLTHKIIHCSGYLRVSNEKIRLPQIQ